MRSRTLKIEHARYVVTLDGERRIIQDGSILIEGARISRVGKAAELADAPADRMIDGRALLVTPGFFNGHMHISYAHAVRGIFPDDLGSPLPYVFKLQMAMTEEEEYHTTLLGLVELLKNGTVCFVDPGSTKFPDACLQAYEDAGIRVILGECVTDRDGPVPAAALPAPTRRSPARRPSSRSGTAGSTGGCGRGRCRSRRRPAAPTSWAAQAPGGRARDRAHAPPRKRRRRAARSTRREYGLRPTEYLESIGVLGPNVLLAHVLGLDDAEIECLARTGTAVAMCPVTAAKGAKGIAAERPDAGAARSGASRSRSARDSPNNSNHLDMVRDHEHGGHPVQGRPPGHAPDPGRDGARDGHARRRAGARAGPTSSARSTPGKKADLVLFDTQRPEWQALFNPVNNLVYNADGRSVHTVIVDGRVVVDAYRQTFVDEERLYARVQEIGEQLLARTGVTLPRSRWPIV